MRLIPLLAVTLLLAGCGKGSRFTAERFETTSPQTEAEVLAEYGPGTEVCDSYATRLLADHNLPPMAKVLRWSDPTKPSLYSHVVIADGKVVERTVWDSRAK